VSARIEDQADAMGDAAEQMAELMAARPRGSLEPIAIFLAMGRALDAVKRTAEQLHGQGWLALDETIEDDALAASRLSRALDALNDASGLFEEIAHGWL
jgi:hypothetical protein